MKRERIGFVKQLAVEQSAGQQSTSARSAGMPNVAVAASVLAAAAFLFGGCTPPPNAPATPEPAEPSVTPVAGQPNAPAPGTPEAADGAKAPTAGQATASGSDPNASAMEACTDLCKQLETGCKGADSETCRANCAAHLESASRCPVELDAALACQAEASDAVACQNVAAPSCASAFNQLNACQTGKAAAKKKTAS